METPENKKIPAADLYAGAAIDVADDKKVDKKLEKERTKTINNNPRDTDDKNM